MKEARDAGARQGRGRNGSWFPWTRGCGCAPVEWMRPARGPMGNADREFSPLRSGAWVAVAVLSGLFLVYATARFSLGAPMGLWLKYTYLTAPLVMACLYAALSRSEGFLRTAGAVPALILSVCLIVLVGVWQAGVSDFHMIGGLLPYSDARDYYADALRLLHGQRFSTFSSRRPLFPAFLAGILRATDLDLRTALILLTGMTALAISFAVREVRRSLGLAAATVMLLCLFLFYRRYIGSTLTEHLGLAFGCLAFTLIWRGAVARRRDLVLFGLFLLSLGLNARAGAFLVLPAILLWVGCAFWEPRRVVVWTLAGGVAAIVLGFALNSALLSAVGVPGAAYSNFSYTFYGLVSGGNWSQVFQQHPELATLAPLEQADRVYALAWDRIRTDPLSLPVGCLRAWYAFFLGRSGAWFSHILYLSPDWADLREMLLAEGVAALNFRRDAWILLDVAAREVWIIALNGLMIVGLVVLWRNRRRSLALLTIAAWAGILLSVPFAPPWDADNMRAYAATLPFVVALPIAGLTYGRTGKLVWEQGERQNRAPRSTGLLTFCAILLGLQILGPLSVKAGWAGRSTEEPAASCTVNCEAPGRVVRLYIDPRATVHLVNSAEDGRAIVAGNTLSLRDLRARIHMKDYPDTWHMWRTISRMPAGTALTLAFDPRRGNAVYVQSHSGTVPRSPGVVALCGESVRQGWIDWFRADTVAACGTQSKEPSR